MVKDENFVVELANILRKNRAIDSRRAKVLAKEFKKSRGMTFEEFLVSENFVKREPLLKALEEYFKVPLFDVRGIFFKKNLLGLFAKEVLLRYSFIPYARDKNILLVITSNPGNPDLLDVIGRYVSYDIFFRVGYFRDIHRAINEYYDPSLSDIFMGYSREKFDEENLEDNYDYEIFPDI